MWYPLLTVKKRRVMSEHKKIINKDYFYVLPAAMLIIGFFISSIGFTIYISFFEWNGVSPMEFCGFDNYFRLFSDHNFRISLINTLVWVIGGLIINVAFPLLLAILITNVYLSSTLKNLFYLPTALSLTVGGLIMSSLLSAYGIPQICAIFGREDLIFDWLSIPYINTVIMILMTAWQGIGLNLLLFIGGLRSVDESPIEAAIIDGARKVTLYSKVILPMIKPTIVVVLLMALVNSFKVFDNIWVMTKGGPYRTSETLALTMYIESFAYRNLGAGAAISVVLSVVVLLISYFYLKDSFKG